MKKISSLLCCPLIIASQFVSASSLESLSHDIIERLKKAGWSATSLTFISRDEVSIQLDGARQVSFGFDENRSFVFLEEKKHVGLQNYERNLVLAEPPRWHGSGNSESSSEALYNNRVEEAAYERARRAPGAFMIGHYVYRRSAYPAVAYNFARADHDRSRIDVALGEKEVQVQGWVGSADERSSAPAGLPEPTLVRRTVTDHRGSLPLSRENRILYAGIDEVSEGRHLLKVVLQNKVSGQIQGNEYEILPQEYGALKFKKRRGQLSLPSNLFSFMKPLSCGLSLVK